MSLEIHAVSTTVSCQVSGGDGHLSAEIDSREWGYNGGRSQYYPGDDCYVIVYHSNNLTMPTTGICSQVGTSFGVASGKLVGYNLKREGITFSTPIAQAGKPLPSLNVDNNGSSFVNCGGPEYLPQTTVIRLKTWKATLTPADPPPAGFLFIEYTPYSIMWSFTDLKRNVQLINTQVHGLIHAVAKAMATTSASWVAL